MVRLFLYLALPSPFHPGKPDVLRPGTVVMRGRRIIHTDTCTPSSPLLSCADLSGGAVHGRTLDDPDCGGCQEGGF